MSVHITPELLQSLAHLCRLRVEESEVPRLTADLERIIGYFDTVAAYPMPPGNWTESATAPQSIAPRADVVRPDEPHRFADARALVDLGPEADYGFYRVPRVLGSTDLSE